MTPPKWALFLFLAALLVAVGYVVFVPRQVMQELPPSAAVHGDDPETRDQPPDLFPDVGLLERSPVDSPGELPRQAMTARQYLQDYWGERWPEIEQAMLEANVDLEQPYEPVPWEAASAALEPLVLATADHRRGGIAGVVRWAPDSDPDAKRKWLREEFSVPESVEVDALDLQAIDEIARVPNEELSRLGEEKFDRIDLYSMQRWRSGDFVKAPFGTIGVSKALGFYSKSAAAAGWSFILTLERERYPDIVELEAASSQLREKRDYAVTEYFRGLSRRRR